MKVIGLGNDLVDINRIARSIERFGQRFTERIFTEAERALADRRTQRAATYAKRFAAKEACAKALGTGFSSGVFWRDIGVVNNKAGAPTLALTGGALARLVALTPPGMRAELHLTMTDEPPLAQAMVLIVAYPD